MQTGQNITNLGVTHKIGGRVIDLTDTAMQAQTRRAIERKYEDTKIVASAKWMLREGFSPEEIYDAIEQRVLVSNLT